MGNIQATNNKLKSSSTNNQLDENTKNKKLFLKNSDKKAILVGLNYVGTSAALQGCINDANRMRQTLIKYFDYTDTKVYTDGDLSVQKNILQVLDEVIDSGATNMFFQYSGHGTQQRDLNGDEADGMDEALYSVNGTIIVDDQINERVKKVGSGKQLVMIFDACHSGTMVDLPYQLKNSKVVKVNNNVVNGDIICISGCRDNQVSMDVRQDGTAYGAMSNALQTVINNLNGKKVTWKTLIGQLQSELKKKRYAQVPELTVSRAELINEIVNI